VLLAVADDDDEVVSGARESCYFCAQGRRCIDQDYIDLSGDRIERPNKCRLFTDAKFTVLMGARTPGHKVDTAPNRNEHLVDRVCTGQQVINAARVARGSRTTSVGDNSDQTIRLSCHVWVFRGSAKRAD
jgi:hypothetical protein